MSRYLIDTSVLLHDPRAAEGVLSIADAPQDPEIYIPLYALEELDQIKEEHSDRGQRAREVNRRLDRLRRSGSIGLGTSEPHSSGDPVRIHLARCEESALPRRLQAQPSLIYDWLIMKCAVDLDATLVTLDINLRLRALESGIAAVEWISDLSPTIPLEAQENPHNRIEAFRDEVWGIRALNEEQAQALGALLDSTIELVILTGKAGTGKTLIALAAGLEQTTTSQRYDRVLVSRAIFPLGKDIGYLPGTLEEKMEPWLQPIYDNLDLLLGLREPRRPHRQRPRAEELIDLGLIEVVPITYIRGRSISSQFLIVDEAQNLTPHEMKTMLTRAGKGTKVILLGDPHQVDHPYLNAEHNGLVYVAQRFAHQACAAHIHLSRGERSPLAELAADLL